MTGIIALFKARKVLTMKRRESAFDPFNLKVFKIGYAGIIQSPGMMCSGRNDLIIGGSLIAHAVDLLIDSVQAKKIK